MRAILIDPFKRTKEEVQIEQRGGDGCYHDIKDLIGQSPLTTVRVDDRNVLFIDDEGLYRAGQCYFFASFYPNQPLAGRAVICGVDRMGETVPCTLPVVHLITDVMFPDVQPEFSHVETRTSDEAGFFVVEGRAKFK